jgi:ankyrin repeat protein
MYKYNIIALALLLASPLHGVIAGKKFEPIHAAASAGNLKGVKAALVRGAQINVQDSNGDTALHRAARAGHASVVYYLIGQRAHLNVKNNKGRTPLYLVAERLRTEQDRQKQRQYARIGMTLLEFRANPNIADNNKNTPLHAMMGKYRSSNTATTNICGPKPKRQQKEEIIRMPVDAAKNKISLVIPLLYAGANPNAQNNHGATPLHVAAREGYVSFAHDLFKVHHAPGKKVIAVNVHIKDDQGKTPLHWAALKGHYQLVDDILKHGGNKDINLPDNRGRTPLQWVLRQRGKGAVFYGVGYHMPAQHALNIMRLLLEHGADPLLKDSDGKSALDWSIARPLTNPQEAQAEQNLLRSYATRHRAQASLSAMPRQAPVTRRSPAVAAPAFVH